MPAPIDIQIVGPSAHNREIANQLLASLHRVPGLVDLRLQQVFNQPELHVATDRSRAQQLGISQHDIANDLLLTLSGSGTDRTDLLAQPGVGAAISAGHPGAAVPDDLPAGSAESAGHEQRPVADPRRARHDLARLRPCRSSRITTLSRSSTSSARRRTATWARSRRQIKARIAALEKQLPKGTHIVIRGQIQTMAASYTGLAIGFAGAIILVYLLIVINFQSWLDPFIIITALPAAMAGIAWMLLDHWHDPERAGADRRDHVHGGRHCQQHSGRQLCSRPHE